MNHISQLSTERVLLHLIGRRFPAVHDLIPRGPLEVGARFAALNPQPLPPLELGVLLAREAVSIAVLAELTGAGSPRIDVDDWCPTYPRRPKIPWWWPVPPPEPEPGPDWLVDFHLGVAATVFGVVEQLGSAAFGADVLAMGERSLEALQEGVRDLG
jgi:hypothetical protein